MSMLQNGLDTNSVPSLQTVDNFEIMIDGKMQPINFDDNPIFKHADSRLQRQNLSLNHYHQQGSVAV